MRWGALLIGLLVAGCGGPDDPAPLIQDMSAEDAAPADLGQADAGADVGADADAAGLSDPAPPASDFNLELGLGHRAFSMTPAGTVAPLQRGCQGAQHVWISLRSPDLAPGDLTNYLRAVRVRDGETVVPTHSLVLPWEADGSGAALIGVTLVIFDPVAVVGELIDVHAEVEAPDGRTGRAVIRVQVEWGPDAC